MTKANGKVKTKRVWKSPPEVGLSENDQKLMKEFSKRAWNLDMFFAFCGLHIGWSAFIGIVPVIGDCINIWMSLRLVHLAQKIDGGLPVMVQSKMMANITIDFLLGITPVLGIIAGALYKSNSRNALLLLHHLQTVAAENVRHGKYTDQPQKKTGGWFSFGAGNKHKAQDGSITAAAVTEAPAPATIHASTKSKAKPSARDDIELLAQPQSQSHGQLDAGVFRDGHVTAAHGSASPPPLPSR